MIPKLLRNRWFWLCTIICLIGGCVWLWMERTTLQGWYAARQVAGSTAEQRTQHLDRLIDLDTAAVPALMTHLGSSNEQARANCSWALVQLGQRWRKDPARSLLLLRAFDQSFASLNANGRGEALACLAGIGTAGDDEPTMPAAWNEGAAQLLVRAAEHPEAEVRRGALTLAQLLVRQERSADYAKLFTTACRRLAEAGLRDEVPATRAVAVRVAARPELNLLDQIAPLAFGPKADANPEIRSLALTAVAAHEEIAGTEELLPLLHDADPEVRATCEHALRGRGLTGPHVQLARQMTDPQPGIRARVPAQVQEFADLDSRLWLDRLSKDPSPAVRAAVLRAAAEGDIAQLAERFQTMAHQDPSPTVRQIAAYYLRTR